MHYDSLNSKQESLLKNTEVILKKNFLSDIKDKPYLLTILSKYQISVSLKYRHIYTDSSYNPKGKTADKLLKSVIFPHQNILKSVKFLW